MGARSTAPLWWWRWWRGPLVGEGTKGLFLLSAGCSRLPPLLTGGEGGLGGPPEDLHGLVVPLDDVALQAGGAVGQGQDLRRGQHVVPHAELRQLPHEGLRGIKAAAQRVLGMGKGMEVRLASGEAPPDPINQSPAAPRAGGYLLLAQDDDALGLDGVPRGQVLAGAPLLAVLVRRPLAVPGGPRHTDVVPGLVLQAQRQLGDLWVESESSALGGAAGGPLDPSGSPSLLGQHP